MTIARKFQWTAAVLVSISVVPAFAMGNGASGGGDLCEKRIEEIRDDLSNWIANGGSKGLKFPAGVTEAQYNSEMPRQVAQAKIRCVKSGDVGYPVQINGTPKVCRFDVFPNAGTITCDYSGFLASQNADQYVLVHHEYAGLAGLEPPTGDVSQYPLSGQISSFLSATIDQKLFVPNSSTDRPTTHDILRLGFIPKFNSVQAVAYCKAMGGHIPDPREVGYIAQSLGAKLTETVCPDGPSYDQCVLAESYHYQALGYDEIQLYGAGGRNVYVNFYLSDEFVVWHDPQLPGLEDIEFWVAGLGPEAFSTHPGKFDYESGVLRPQDGDTVPSRMWQPGQTEGTGSSVEGFRSTICLPGVRQEVTFPGFGY